MKFTHKNIDITINDRAQFIATINGVLARKPSLDTMKKHIDDMLAKAFVPFVAMIQERYNHKPDKDGFVVVNVIGLNKSDANWRRGKLDFVIEIDGKRENTSMVYVDTPANRKALIAVRKHIDETQRIEAQRDKELEELRAKVVKHESKSEPTS